MTPDQWRRVRDIFERAVDQPPDRIEQWVAHEAADPDVAAEVVSLLRHHTRAGTFLEAAVTERVPGVFDDEPVRAPGERVGDYVIEREIGRGGMGRVYLATDSRLGRRVALKALRARAAGDESQRARLTREAQTAAGLRHPGICTVYALETISGDLFIAAEFIEGRTLREEIEAARRPTPDELTDTARELTAAVAAAHAAGITHRDIKPENVMRGVDGRLKVLDFGLAVADPVGVQVEEPRITMPGAVIGTPAYMSPEQLNGRAADTRTDVFALGVLLYEYATGAHPFAADAPLAMAGRILEHEPPSLSTLRPDVPRTLADAVSRALKKHPPDRFASAGEFLVALGRSDPRDRGSHERPRWWITHMVAMLATYFVAVFAGWLVKEWDRIVGLPGFVLLAAAATTGGVLRAHLLFAQRAHDAATFRRELARWAPVLMTTDLAIAAVLFLAGLWVAINGRPVPGVLTLALGLGIGLARVVVERLTTEAAFDA